MTNTIRSLFPEPQCAIFRFTVDHFRKYRFNIALWLKWRRERRSSLSRYGRGIKKKRNLAPRNFVNAVREQVSRKEMPPDVSRRAPFGRNVIFPTVLIARDIISNSRQSASDIPPLSSVVPPHSAPCRVRRGVICDHNSPLNVGARCVHEVLHLFPSRFSSRLVMYDLSSFCSPSLSPSFSLIYSLSGKSSKLRALASLFPFPADVVTIYEHIFRVSRGKPSLVIDRRTCSGEPAPFPRFNLRFCARNLIYALCLSPFFRDPWLHAAHNK